MLGFNLERLLWGIHDECVHMCVHMCVHTCMYLNMHNVELSMQDALVI